GTAPPAGQTYPAALPRPAPASISAAFADPSSLRAQRRQLLLDALVTAIEMVDAVDRRRPFGYEPGDYQAGGRAQIGGHDVGSGEPRDAFDDCSAALDLNLRTEPLQFLHVHHAVFENRLGDHRGIVSDR